MKLRTGDILEIVNPPSHWRAFESWKGRIVIVKTLHNEGGKIVFNWISSAPDEWRNKILFNLDPKRVKGIFKRIGRAKE